MSIRVSDWRYSDQNRQAMAFFVVEKYLRLTFVSIQDCLHGWTQIGLAKSTALFVHMNQNVVSTGGADNFLHSESCNLFSPVIPIADNPICIHEVDTIIKTIQKRLIEIFLDIHLRPPICTDWSLKTSFPKNQELNDFLELLFTLVWIARYLEASVCDAFRSPSLDPAAYRLNGKVVHPTVYGNSTVNRVASQALSTTIW
jgi:hypothetical protein